MSYFFPSRSHFENGNGWSGSMGPLRYEIEGPKDGKFVAVTWPEPFSRPFAQEFERAEFELTDDGLAAVQDWVRASAQRWKNRGGDA